MDPRSEHEALDAAEHALAQHEQELWDELMDALRSAVPPDATPVRAEEAMARALICDKEAMWLFSRVATLGLASCGYLRDRLEEDGPTGILRQMMLGEDAEPVRPDPRRGT